MSLTPTQLRIIAHSLGILIHESIMSDKKKDKTLPAEYYRNYYNTLQKDSMQEFIDNGLMEEFQKGYYRVTKYGMSVFKDNFEEIVKYKPEKERNGDYLKHKINMYCFMSHYKFGNNNAEHVIRAYHEYYLKDCYMSHTTTDCIVKFKRQLKQYHKKGLI